MEKYCNIRVTNIETREVYEHRSVPLDHVEWLLINENLKIEILESSRDRRSLNQSDD